jgi:hypothetical protein
MKKPVSSAISLASLVAFTAIFAGCSRSSLGLDDYSFLGEGGQSGNGNGGAGNGAGFGGEAGFGNGGNSAGFAGVGGGGNAGFGGADGRECTVSSDCPGSTFCALQVCQNFKCITRTRDLDGDGAIDASCGGTDCDDSRFDVRPGAPEKCGDGLDNNCDGALDCSDVACEGVPGCVCIPGVKESCGSGLDEDCDGLKDCDDSDCATNPVCICQPLESNCSDGKDENCNGLIDCGDPQCFGTKECSKCDAAETSCTNTADDDCDGLVDCLDSDCNGSPACACAPSETKCGDGRDDDCDGKIDCADTDCKADPTCGCLASETNCGDGRDDDCDGTFDCKDSDCAASPICGCQASAEVCNDGKDNDCNDLIDCADPACTTSPLCKCQGPAQPEVCDDGVDNDCDNLVDCADPNCIGKPACSTCKTEICDDGIDNDCDGAIDCADIANCAFEPSCVPTPEQCNNGKDDDSDGAIDCSDTDCIGNPFCATKQSNCLNAKPISASGTYTGDTTGNIPETRGTCGGDAGEAVFSIIVTVPTRLTVDTDGTQFDATLYLRKGACESGREIACNDDFKTTNKPPPAHPSIAQISQNILYPGSYYLFLDGFTIDAQKGPNQGPFVLNVDLVPNPKEICGDGIDNDGDVYVDCGDPDCVKEAACQCNAPQAASAEFGRDACTDGVDNDCDGKVDENDDDCRASEYYQTEVCNGIDDNGNLIADDFSCRCSVDNECNPGQICYRQTTNSCGPRCDQFVGWEVGGVCPFIAPGSVCNPSTGQCTFP